MIRDSVSGLLGAPYRARLIAALALVFGLYPAIRASRLSPMEARR